MKPLLSFCKQNYIKILLFVIVVAVVCIIRVHARFKIVDVVNRLPKHPTERYTKRSLNQINGIVVHHSASIGQSAIDYAKYHISKSWPGIGYHYVIYPNGRIEQTNHLDTISYHTQGVNSSTIGICLSGNFDAEKPNAKNIASLKKLIHHLRRQFVQELDVRGHKDYQSTHCPGKHLYQLIQTL